jgi:hypothetical protein
MNPGFDTGFASCHDSERSLAWMVKRGKVALGKSLAKKIRLNERSRDGYLS